VVAVEDVREALLDGRRGLPGLGAVRAGTTATLPFVVVDESGDEIEPFSVFLRDLMLTDMSPLTARSYGNDLLRWWRLLRVLEMAWDRATRAEVDVLVGWMRTADNSRPASCSACAGSMSTGPASRFGEHRPWCPASRDQPQVVHPVRHRPGQPRTAYPHRRSPTRTPQHPNLPRLRPRVPRRRHPPLPDPPRQPSRRPTHHRIPAVTDAEWAEFEQHFDKRKVELGQCGRPYATPCEHEHACIRCPILRIDPKMIDRLDEIHTDLLARRDHAQTQGWLGEIQGIDLTLRYALFGSS
jgi:hypothetical protein